MTLVYDARQELNGRPGVHALIAGVSAYKHLPANDNEPDPPGGFGMRQLSSTALTAYYVYQWLLQRKDKLPAPLATIRLLLSPCEEETQAEPDIENLCGLCTKDAFIDAAWDWREDAKQNADGVTVFYFAGHGIQRSKDDAVMLLHDFGQQKRPLLEHAVDMHSIYNGMSPTTTPSNIAKTQFYFVDACRNQPSQLANFEMLKTTEVFNASLKGRDERHAPIFYAAVSNSAAYAIKGKQTIFSLALLYCLSGAAGSLQRDTAGRRYWAVTVKSLDKTLETYFSILPPELRGNQEYTISGLVKDAVLHKLDVPPKVEVSISVDPNQASSLCGLKILDSRDHEVYNAAPFDPHPYNGTVDGGYYHVKVSFQQAHPTYEDCEDIYYAEPPLQTWTLPVSRQA